MGKRLLLSQYAVRLTPADHPYPALTVTVTPAMDQYRLRGGVAGKRPPFFQAGKRLAGYGLAGFDFHRQQLCPLFDDKVNLITITVPPEMAVGTLTTVETGFHQLGNHAGLEDVAPQRMGLDLFRRLNTQKPGDEPHVEEIEFGGFDQPLVEISMVGPEQKDDITCLQLLNFQHLPDVPLNIGDYVIPLSRIMQIVNSIYNLHNTDSG